jgi:hypothetical protein
MTEYRFTSDLFEIEPGEDEEINPRMHGRQLAAWFKERLTLHGYAVEPVIAEDWGRCLMCSRKPFMLWVGCGNLGDHDDVKPGDPPPVKEDVIWRCFPEAELSLWRRWFRKIDAAPALASLDRALRDILANEPRIRLLEGC